MKWKWIVALAVAGWLTLRLANLMQAEPMTYYSYLTDIENTRYNEIIWFWTPDTMFGPVHSNDFIGLRYSPSFYGPISTSQSQFLYYQPQNIYFAYDPVFNAAPYNFPRRFRNLLRLSTDRFDGHDSLMTVIRFRGDEGAYVYQRVRGEEADDSLVAHIQFDRRRIVYVDGEVEMEGIVAGQVTVYATGDIGLLDDVRYLGSDEHSGYFDEANTNAMLGVVSEGNVIIRNTIANGRANGFYVDQNDWNRHSIVINGSIIALGESFTFEDQNDNWEQYQGPTPDERGRIYLHGGVAQLRRGYLHRSNHGTGGGNATGYGMSWHYDHRLQRTGPPGFAPGESDEITGDIHSLSLSLGTYQVHGARIGSLRVEHGVELQINGSNGLIVTDSLIVEGTPEDSVHFTPLNGGGRVTVDGSAYSSLRCLDVAPNVVFSFTGDTLNASGVVFGDEFDAQGALAIDSCSFARSATLTGWQRVSVTRSLFTGGLTLGGSPRECAVTNCTIAGFNGTGLRVRSSVTPRLLNDIVAFNRVGILNDRPDVLEYRYCDVFGNSQDDYVGCRAGVGSISEDPLFVDRRSGDFHLTASSPCIDAGDPNSPRDPDGTRADIGAYFFPHQMTVPGETPSSFRLNLSVAPNPFNERTKVTVEVPAAGKMRLAVFDVSGRLRGTLFDGEIEKGSKAFALDASGWPAGVYLVRMVAGRGVKVGKVVKVN